MEQDVYHLFLEGVTIERKHFKDIMNFLQSVRQEKDCRLECSSCKSSIYLSSDAGHIMGKGEPFAACYMDTPEGRVYSLRSSDDGLDVGELQRSLEVEDINTQQEFRVKFDQIYRMDNLIFRISMPKLLDERD